MQDSGIGSPLGPKTAAVLNLLAQLPATCWGVLRIAVHRFRRLRAAESAAGMAYYALFSLFPLLLFLVAMGSLFLRAEAARQQVLSLVTGLFPTAQDLVIRNIEQALESRGTVGTIAAAGFLWSATGFFRSLFRNVNRAWPGARSRSLVGGRLLGLIMVAGLAAFLILWLLCIGVLDLLSHLNLPYWSYTPLIHAMLSRVIPWILTFVLFVVLYRWVPLTDVDWRAATWSALVATIAWRVATAGFAWYLSSGLSKYRLVYGSLGSIVALMFWIYVTSGIVLFGAHLSAAIHYVRRMRTDDGAEIRT